MNNKMSLYQFLEAKMDAGTITKDEENLLMELAFGTEFIRSKDKGRLREY